MYDSQFSLSGPFDLFVGHNSQVPARFESDRAWIVLASDLATARARALELREIGIGCRVLPARYRRADLPETQAAEIAAAYLETQKRVLDRYGPMYSTGDGGAWWSFAAENFDAQARGLIPGVQSCCIDKLAARVLSRSEEWGLINLSPW